MAKVFIPKGKFRDFVGSRCQFGMGIEKKQGSQDIGVLFLFPSIQKNIKCQRKFHRPGKTGLAYFGKYPLMESNKTFSIHASPSERGGKRGS
jgi:hypothetical protein